MRLAAKLQLEPILKTQRHPNLSSLAEHQQILSTPIPFQRPANPAPISVILAQTAGVGPPPASLPHPLLLPGVKASGRTVNLLELRPVASSCCFWRASPAGPLVGGSARWLGDDDAGA